MQMGEKHKNAKTLDNWARSTKRDFDEYKNFSTRLENVSYPGIAQGIADMFAEAFGGEKGPTSREARIGELTNSVKRLVDAGFEQQARATLAEKGLSPTEIEGLIHPFTPEQKEAIKRFPDSKGEKSQGALVDFLRKNVTNDTSLLAMRHGLWQDKGYDWKQIASAMNEAIGDKLTIAQQNEMGILETEPPRRALSSIFRDWAGLERMLRGQK
jgi:hypothetical protein